ncbi:TetR/AcrR family transcriptional regulator [Halorubrum halodurans]|uniref:HTH tetR-type domain-containing protein n=1 Tax=Halorubrum halodurans TaxID=1383851 RepID=A0A256IBT3_9EURY|nr:TetR/AcrR family transcriptional regulator [Halorubrum halodurans]OYR53994.1 hypothetical protein DJ70_15140 [Halorubrum halodurans]
MPEDSEQQTRDAIMKAAFNAVAMNGYSQVSITDITEEFGKSRSLLYYHYDSKDDILVSLLEYVLIELMAELENESTETAREELELLLEKLLPSSNDASEREMYAVILELRVQAVTNESFREQFTAVDQQLFERIDDIVQRGIENGEFQPVDSNLVCEHIFASLNGAHMNKLTTSRDGITERTKASLYDYLNHRLYRGDENT